jgi:hypothetical protein
VVGLVDCAGKEWFAESRSKILLTFASNLSRAEMSEKNSKEN